jgi:tetratricopeptide (TPR) repeat protein
VVFDLERHAVYKHRRLTSFNHATIMIRDVVLGQDAQHAIVNAGVPHSMKIYPWKGDWVRVDLDLDVMGTFKILNLDNPYRLVVDLFDVSERRAPGVSESQVSPEADALSGPSPEDELPTELTVMPPADTSQPGSDPKSRYVMARTFLSDRLYGKTIEVLSPVFHSPPNEWQPWYLMAVAALGLGHLDDSEHYVIEGLTRDGSIPQLWVQRALIAQQRENHELALNALGQAARLEPDLPEIHLNMAYSFEVQGKVDRATEHYRRFLALTEHNAAYHMVRKKVLTRVMQFKT